MDSSGKVVRKYASNDPAPPPDPELAIPAYWLRPPMLLSSKAGFHRFLWDMHLSPVPGIKPEYPIAAVYKNTAPAANFAVGHAGEIHGGAHCRMASATRGT